MDPLSCENAIYEDIKAESSIDIFENKCYGKVTSSANITKQGGVKKNHSCSKVIIMVFVIVFALLLGTAGACVAFALQITTLKSEITSLQMASSSQNTFTDTLEEVVHQLNTSIDMLYQQLSQQNASNEQLNEQLNQQWSQQNASLDSSYQQLRQEYSALDNRTQQLNKSTQLLLNGLGPPGRYSSYPAGSCAALPPSSPSGYYWVRASDGSDVSVYCDMTRSCGGVTGGWMRVAELDMTNSSHQCPSGLMERTDPGKRTCVRNGTTIGCSSINNFITPGVDYSSVCGRVIGYQYGSTDAFFGDNINSIYVDGVSLTHGDPRQHIWTFAAAQDEVGSYPSGNCPCINTNQAAQASHPPAFVGNDYFCDTGSEEFRQIIFYGDDPLWDGAGCGPLNTCCSFNTPPWFYKQLPQSTTDDIEMRVCTIGDPIDNEEVAIEIVEMYVR